MRTDLRDDPAVVGLATELNLDEDTIIGKLHRFWSWADAQTYDGNAPTVTQAFLDRYISVTGFVQALLKVGWLKENGDGFTIPNFDRHNGKTAKSRGLTMLRVQRYRSVTPALPEKSRSSSSSSKKTPETGGEVETLLLAAGVFPEVIEYLVRDGVTIEHARTVVNQVVNAKGVKSRAAAITGLLQRKTK